MASLSKKTSISKRYLNSLLDSKANDARSELGVVLKNHPRHKANAIKQIASLVKDIRVVIRRCDTNLTDSQQLDTLCSQIDQCMTSAYSRFRTAHIHRDFSIPRRILEEVRQQIADNYELPDPEGGPEDSPDDIGEPDGTGGTSESSPSENNEPKTLHEELADNGIELTNALNKISDHLNGLAKFTSGDFLESVGADEDLNFKKKLTSDQVRQFMELFKGLKAHLRSAIGEELLREDLKYEDLIKVVAGAIEPFNTNDYNLPQRVMDLFKEWVLDIMLEYLKTPQTLQGFFSLFPLDGDALTKEEIRCKLVLEKVRAVEDAQGGKPNYPFTSEEQSRLMVLDADNSSRNQRARKIIKATLNREFHGGVRLRTAGVIMDEIEFMEHLAEDQRKKAMETAEAAQAGEDPVIEAGAVPEVEYGSDIGDSGVEAQPEPVSVGGAIGEIMEGSVLPKEGYDDIELSKPIILISGDSPRVDPELVADCSLASAEMGGMDKKADVVKDVDPPEETVVSDFKEADGLSELRKLDLADDEGAEDLAEVPQAEVRKPVDSDGGVLHDVASELTARLGATVEAVEGELKRLKLHAELLKMREGLIVKIRQYFELRNPSLEAIRTDAMRLQEILNAIEERKDDLLSKLSILISRKTKVRSNSALVKTSDSPILGESVDKLRGIAEDFRVHLGLLREVGQIMEEWDAYKAEVRDFRRRHTELTRDSRRGDLFFESKITDTAFGADSRVLLGEENLYLLEKDETCALMLDEMLVRIRRCEANFEVAEAQIKDAISKTDDTKISESLAVLENLMQLREDNDRILVNVEGTEYAFTSHQIRIILVLTAWGTKNKMQGRTPQRLSALLASVFSNIPQIDVGFLNDQIRLLEEKLDEPRERAPGTDIRSRSRRFFIRWIKRNGTDMLIPTHKAYTAAEELARMGRGLSEEELQLVQTAKEEAGAGFYSMLGKTK